VGTKTASGDYTENLVTSGVELTTGKHYWELEILNDGHGYGIYVGVTRPSLDPNGDYTLTKSTDGWVIWTYGGGLFGNGKRQNDEVGDIDAGDHVGVLLDLDEGSLRFFKNGVQHGPGYPAGSVTGPVMCAVQMRYSQASGCFHKTLTTHCCSRTSSAARRHSSSQYSSSSR
jgi:hypothetical protein